MGDYPSTSNSIPLAGNTCHSFQVRYTRNHTIIDSVDLLVGTSCGIFSVQMFSQEKGEVHLEVLPVLTEEEELIQAEARQSDEHFVIDWLDMGAVPAVEDGAKTRKFTITNVEVEAGSNKVLVVDRIEMCDQFSTTFQLDQNSINWSATDHKLYLAPGISQEVTLIFQPPRRGLYEDCVSIWHNDERLENGEPAVENPYEMKVLGTGVVPELSIEPSSLNIGQVLKGNEKVMPVSLYNRGGAPLEIDAIVMTDPYDHVIEIDLKELDIEPRDGFLDETPLVIQPGKFVEIDLSCTPVGEEPYANELQIVSNSVGGGLNQKNILCTGIVASAAIYPEVLDFGSVRVCTDAMNDLEEESGEEICQTSERYVNICNSGRSHLDIVDVRFEGTNSQGELIYSFSSIDDFGDSWTIDPGKCSEYWIGYRPMPSLDELTQEILAGPIQEVVTFTVEPMDVAGDATTIHLYGTKIAPLADVRPAGCSYDCPSSVEFENAQAPDSDLEDEYLDDFKVCKRFDVVSTGSEKLTIGAIRAYHKVNVSGGEHFVQDQAFTISGEIERDLPVDIAPDDKFSFELCFLPIQMNPDPNVFTADYEGKVVLCSSAVNEDLGSSTGCPAMPSGLEPMRPIELMLYGNAIDPELSITPQDGELTFETVSFDPPQSETKTFTIENTGIGPLTIESIKLDDDASPDLKITMIDFPEGFVLDDVYQPSAEVSAQVTTPFLLNEVNSGSVPQQIVVSIKYAPTSDGTARGSVIIRHNDRGAARTLDDVPDEEQPPPGADYPEYRVKIQGNGKGNNLPVALVKSPPGRPSGRVGTREITYIVGVNQEITLDSSDSYDPDSGSAIEDWIDSRTWSSPQADQIIWGGALDGDDGGDTQITAEFLYPGVYEIYLTVYDRWGEPSERTADSTLIVNALQGPVAIPRICNPGYEGYSSIEIYAGETVCLDGLYSQDPDHPDDAFLQYRWYLREEGQLPAEAVNISTASRFEQRFYQGGHYVVSLEVVDEDGLISAREDLSVSVIYNDSIRVELVWNNGGDVNLHWIKPNGRPNDISDCREENPQPPWTGYGRPEFMQASEMNGPEIVVHPRLENNPDLDPELDFPGNGTYKAYAHYEEASETCHQENVCEERHNDCGCGCKNSFWCILSFCGIAGIINSCCEDCTICHLETFCEPLSAHLTFFFYINDAPYATYSATGNNAILYNTDDTYSCSITRTNGRFDTPPSCD